ncbi:hypothetical protein BDW22DRAFT_1412644 [Trametopsis cervina]|nr:hypothetical protein BDW22DRAFT_1412644 [Trametopsis cervina]
MSARKRKFQTEVKPRFEAIVDILMQIKPKLNETKWSASSSLISDLHKLATLAESMGQHRLRSNRDWLAVADTLDREGVYLWNTSSSIKDGADDASREVVAALRLAGFRLIEAGLEQNPSIDTLIHVLQLASKSGASLSETARHDAAAAVLTSAAKYEEQLRTIDDPAQLFPQAKSQAIVLYLSCRMEAAWREGNNAVAEFMLQKITENEQRLRALRQSDRESLALKLLEIGKAVLRNVREAEPSSGKTQYHSAIKWLQKAFLAAETSPEENAGSQVLKHSILRSLARGYYLSSSHDPGNLDRAEAALNELISTVDINIEPGGVQQLRWMRIAILKKRNAAESELLDAFKSIVDHMSFSDIDVTDILQELKLLQDQYPLVASIHRYGLQKAIGSSNDLNTSCVDRLLLSLLFHCSKDADHARAMRDIETAFECMILLLIAYMPPRNTHTVVNSAESDVPKVLTMACLTLLWQFGDRHYTAKRWAEAADWYLCGTHPVFTSIARSSHAKCFRKAALCHIQSKEYVTASAVLRRCPGTEAATHYVGLLCAVHRGLEHEAIVLVQNMVKAPDFDTKMLLLATQLANESNMKALLLSVLETLLTETRKQPGHGIHYESLALIRCIIRLVVKLMGEPTADIPSLVPTLLGHFSTARALVMGICNGHPETMISKDLSWLWRTAYNCAVQGCMDWGNEEAVSSLFDISRELLELYNTLVLTEADTELDLYIATASFAAVAGRVFSLRKRWESTTESDRQALLVRVSEQTTSCLERMKKLLHNGGEARERVSSFLRAVLVFHAEVSCHLKNWKDIMNVIKEATEFNTTNMDTLEAIAGILWVEKECPVQVLFSALEAILHASLEQETMSVQKFSRWLRAICTILLSRNTEDDRTRAIGYVEQGIVVLEERLSHLADEHNLYPEDERQWLLGISYNTGVECFHASRAEEAKRWFEAATVICRFIPEGKMRSAKQSAVEKIRSEGWAVQVESATSGIVNVEDRAAMQARKSCAPI